MRQAPDQLIAESKKTKEWHRDTARALAEGFSSFGQSHLMGKKAYDTYYGLQNAKDYEYLTGDGEYRMPATVRWMHVSRPYFDILLSTAQSRPFEPSVFAVDETSMDETRERMVQEIVEKSFASANGRQQLLMNMQAEVDQIRQQIQSQAQQTQEAGQAPDPSQAFRLQQVEQGLRRMEQESQRGLSDLDREMEALERKSQRSSQSNFEVELSRGLEFLYHKNGLKETFLKGFESALVVDQEIYTIDDVQEGHDPRLRWVNPMSISYTSTADATYIDECPSVMEERYLPFHQVMADYGPWLSDEQISSLQGKNQDPGGGSFWDWYSSGLFEQSAVGSLGCNTATSYFQSGGHAYNYIRVRRVCWQSPRKIRARRGKAKDDKEIGLTHLIGDEESPRAGEELLERWVSDWRECTIIGSDIYVKEGRCAFQHRDIRDIGKAYGPYIGHAYNGFDRRPYSRVLAVEDINILYNLVMYQIELTIALSGMRGFVMDKAQIPAGLSFKEWMYNLKQGIALIDSTPAGNRRGAEQRYNQFSTFDMTFSDTIQHLWQILAQLDGMLGRILGIPPQRMGEVAHTDQVGTTASAITQSNITTEVLFNKSAYLRQRVMNRYVNTLPYAWANGRRGRYVAGDFGQRMFQIATGELKGRAFEVFFRDAGKEQRIMDVAMQMMATEYGKGTIAFSQLLSLYNTTNLRDLEESVKYYEGMAEKKAAGQMQKEAENEQARLKEQQEYQMMAKRMATDGEKMKVELERFRIDMDANLRRAEMEAKARAEGMKGNITKNVADQNTNVELAYLAEQRRATDIDARLKVLEIATKAGGSSGGSGGSSNNVSSPPSKNDVSDR